MGVASNRSLFRGASAIRALLALTVTLSSVEAWALSCVTPGVSAPRRRSADVPTNTRLWCTVDASIGATEPIVLRNAAGDAISGTQTELSVGGLIVAVFRPDVALEPESTFVYRCPGRDSEITFVTGVGPESTTPALPDVSRWEAEASNLGVWGSAYGVSFHEAVERGNLVVFDVGSEAALDAEGPSGVVSRITEALDLEPVQVGTGGCLSGWPAATSGAVTTVSLGAFDVTGAFSGWSEPVTVTLPATLVDLASGVSDGASDAGGASEAREEEVGVTPDATAPAADRAAASDTMGDSAVTASDASVASGCGLPMGPVAPWHASGALAAIASLVAFRRRCAARLL